MTDKKKQSVLSIQNLSALHHGPYSLEVNSGSCVVITGESGAGKSVFLRMIADLISSEGQVFFDDNERNSFAPSEWRKRVTYIAAESGCGQKQLKSIFLIWKWQNIGFQSLISKKICLM